jgi:enoyl-[acyl-carrier protein] reductase III
MKHSSYMANPKVAVITGGTRGIGKAVSLALAESGARVYSIFARNRQAAEALTREAQERGLDIRCLRADLTDSDAVAACLHSIKLENKQVDCVVHCAASGVHREIEKLSARHIVWTFDVNVVSIHSLLAELLPIMPEGSRIIGISSPGATHALPYYAAVGSSKGALEALFRHYARELAPRGISVNLICPGLVATDAIDAFPDKEARVEATIARTPSGRLTTPEDVAQLALFMCSNVASQIVGQTITIDGGRMLV